MPTKDELQNENDELHQQVGALRAERDDALSDAKAAREDLKAARKTIDELNDKTAVDGITDTELSALREKASEAEDLQKQLDAAIKANEKLHEENGQMQRRLVDLSERVARVETPALHGRIDDLPRVS